MRDLMRAGSENPTWSDKMNILCTTALAVLLASGVAYAQTDGGESGNTGSNSPGAGTTDGGGNADGGGNYLTGDGPGQFYTDDSMSTLKSETEVKSMYEGMSQADRDSLKQACMGNKDTRFNPLCSSIGAM